MLAATLTEADGDRHRDRERNKETDRQTQRDRERQRKKHVQLQIDDTGQLERNETRHPSLPIIPVVSADLAEPLAETDRQTQSERQK